MVTEMGKGPSEGAHNDEWSGRGENSDVKETTERRRASFVEEYDFDDPKTIVIELANDDNLDFTFDSGDTFVTQVGLDFSSGPNGDQDPVTSIDITPTPSRIDDESTPGIGSQPPYDAFEQDYEPEINSLEGFDEDASRESSQELSPSPERTPVLERALVPEPAAEQPLKTEPASVSTSVLAPESLQPAASLRKSESAIAPMAKSTRAIEPDFERVSKAERTPVSERAFAFTPSQSRLDVPKGAVCPKCGKQCAYDDAFCTQCGYDLSTPAQSEPMPMKAIVGIVLAAVAIAAISFLVTSGALSSGNTSSGSAASSSSATSPGETSSSAAASEEPSVKVSEVEVKDSLADYSWNELSALSNAMANAGGRDKALEIARAYNLASEDGSINPICTKAVRLSNGIETSVRIIGFYHDKKADGSGKSGITFMFADAVAMHSMNSKSNNEGGWKSSSARDYLGTEVLEMLPDDLKSVVVAVNKKTNNVGYTSDINSIGVTEDKLWLPSMYEIYGTVENLSRNGDGEDEARDDVYNSEGDRYEVFADLSAEELYELLTNTYDGEAVEWWLRTPRAGNTDSFRCVDDDGRLRDPIAVANKERGMVPCFSL